MKKVARLLLVLVLLAGGFLLLPRPASRVFTGEAQAQIVPTPSIPPIIGDPDGDDGPLPGGGGGDEDDEEEPETDPGDVVEEPEEPGAGDGGDDDSNDGGDNKGDKPNKPGNDAGVDPDDIQNPYTIGRTHITGAFDTDKLVAAAARLRALGVPADEVIAQVYPPFIIAGEAGWSDTWGAPRYGPGPLVRTHEGQDVFCQYGDPILAPADGTVSYSDGGLGGITARVHTSSTSYFYLTHLSDTNAQEIPAGSSVETGDVVGFCGNSGNAITTPPHVHFGWYVNGNAVNPMKSLVKWLRIAEGRVLDVVSQQQRKNVRENDRRTAQRLFGDAFAPDLSELNVSGESLLASGSSPATGAFALAETALQAALSNVLGVDVPGAQLPLPSAESEVATEPESAALQSLLDEAFPYPSEQPD